MKIIIINIIKPELAFTRLNININTTLITLKYHRRLAVESLIMIDATKQNVEMTSVRYRRPRSAFVDYNWPTLSSGDNQSTMGLIDASLSPRQPSQPADKQQPQQQQRRCRGNNNVRRITYSRPKPPESSDIAPPPSPPPAAVVQKSDHQLKSTSNAKLLQWLSAKNHLAAKERRLDRRATRQRYRERREASLEQEGRQLKSAQATRDWLKRKKDEKRALKRQLVAEEAYDVAKEHDGGDKDYNKDYSREVEEAATAILPDPIQPAQRSKGSAKKRCRARKVVTGGAMSRRLTSARKNLEAVASHTDATTTNAAGSDTIPSGITYADWMKSKLTAEKENRRKSSRKYVVVPDNAPGSDASSSVSREDTEPPSEEVEGDAERAIEVITSSECKTPSSPTQRNVPASFKRVPRPTQCQSPSLLTPVRPKSSKSASDRRRIITIGERPDTIGLTTAPKIKEPSYSSKSWDSFADKVWEQVNEDDDDGKPGNVTSSVTSNVTSSVTSNVTSSVETDATRETASPTTKDSATTTLIDSTATTTTVTKDSFTPTTDDETVTIDSREEISTTHQRNGDESTAATTEAKEEITADTSSKHAGKDNDYEEDDEESSAFRDASVESTYASTDGTVATDTESTTEFSSTATNNNNNGGGGGNDGSKVTEKLEITKTSTLLRAIVGDAKDSEIGDSEVDSAIVSSLNADSDDTELTDDQNAVDSGKSSPTSGRLKVKVAKHVTFQEVIIE